eukprot:1495063-Pleurochrysis_carterae.AAC.2
MCRRYGLAVRLVDAAIGGGVATARFSIAIATATAITTTINITIVINTIIIIIISVVVLLVSGTFAAIATAVSERRTRCRRVLCVLCACCCFGALAGAARGFRALAAAMRGRGAREAEKGDLHAGAVPVLNAQVGAVGGAVVHDQPERRFVPKVGQIDVLHACARAERLRALVSRRVRAGASMRAVACSHEHAATCELACTRLFACADARTSDCVCSSKLGESFEFDGVGGRPEKLIGYCRRLRQVTMTSASTVPFIDREQESRTNQAVRPDSCWN